MLNTAQLLDLAKTKNECSDYKLAKLLGVVPSAVTNYRAGRSHPDELVSSKLAELCGLDAAEVTVWIQVERSRDDQSRAIWNLIATRLEKASGVAAAVILSVLFSGGPDAGAQAKSGDSAVVPTHVSEVHSLYIVANKLAAILAFFGFGLRRLNLRAIQQHPHFAVLPNFA